MGSSAQTPSPGPPDAVRPGLIEDIRRGVLAGVAILALVMPPAHWVPLQAAPVSASLLPD